MNCPYCGFRFKVLASNASELPYVAPIVCESCAEVGVLEDGHTRVATTGELMAIKLSPAWRDVIEPAIHLIKSKRN